MERAELKQGFGSDFAKPVARVFYCPRCSTKKLTVALIMRVCEKCGFEKALLDREQ